MKCPKCKPSTKDMSPSAQAYYEGVGVVPVYLCTKCGCAVLKTMYFESSIVYAPYVPTIHSIGNHIWKDKENGTGE